MITIDYLRRILYDVKTVEGEPVNVGLPSVTEPEKEIIKSRAGYDGLMELCKHKNLPFVVVLEKADSWRTAFANDVPVKRFTQSIFVLRMAGFDQDPDDVQELCLADIERIEGLLIRHIFDAELSGLERSWSYGTREGASNYYGYELTLTFTENRDLTCHD